jgi:hypothetical protein
MLADALFQVVGMPCVVAAIGTAQNVNPEHFLSLAKEAAHLP